MKFNLELDGTEDQVFEAIGRLAGEARDWLALKRQVAEIRGDIRLLVRAAADTLQMEKKIMTNEEALQAVEAQLAAGEDALGQIITDEATAVAAKIADLEAAIAGGSIQAADLQGLSDSAAKLVALGAKVQEILPAPAPAPVDPAPVDPAPAPVDPAPVDPAPVDPAPVDPAPVVDPTATDAPPAV